MSQVIAWQARVWGEYCRGKSSSSVKIPSLFAFFNSSLSPSRSCLLCQTQSWPRRLSQWWMTKWPSQSWGSSWWPGSLWAFSSVQAATEPSWLPRPHRKFYRAPNRSACCGIFKYSYNEFIEVEQSWVPVVSRNTHQWFNYGARHNSRALSIELLTVWSLLFSLNCYHSPLHLHCLLRQLDLRSRDCQLLPGDGYWGKTIPLPVLVAWW